MEFLKQSKLKDSPHFTRLDGNVHVMIHNGSVSVHPKCPLADSCMAPIVSLHDLCIQLLRERRNVLRS